ncbi:MAG: peptidoglycan DD-metalloendopeptidase family protein [Sheuella sp.]|nr:peptidoglycan DD-metalloendopeptidase family protein [Sheuella sp.]
MNTKFNAVKRVVCRRSRSGASLFSVAMACLILAGCASQSGSRAPVNDLNQSSSNTATQARTYTVKAGDTLTKISRTTGADENTIKRINKISDPRKIYPGLILKLSDGSETAASGMAPVTPTTRAEVRPLDQADSSSSSASAEPSTPSRASDAGVINWGWPAQGKVIQGFTVNTKGIDIAGAAGDPVIAAANGKVMYSGNGVRGLGNLIIVDHDNGFITAYAHNRALLVKTGQKIKKGTKIAEMGQSDASSVKLHFEVRRQGTPVDPLQYLPAK